MKKIVPFLFAALFVLSSCSYEPGVSEAFTKYRFNDGVTTITVPGWVISLAAGLGDLDESEREILESIDKVKVLAVEDHDLNSRIDLHQEYYDFINKKGDYEELLVVRDRDESVTIFGKMNETAIREMVILVGGNENAMIYIKGEIRPEVLNGKVNITDPDRFLSFDF